MDGEIKGRIHSLESFGAVDGPGIRFVVFFQGCPLRCLYCHNPDSWEASGGTVISARELAEKIVKYDSFIKDGGVTLSGGEPLMQSEFARSLLSLCRKNGYHTAIDTSGCIPLSVCRGAVDEADLLLLDLKAIDSSLAKTITGAGNDNPRRLLEYCERVKKPVWIRHVLLPGYTLDTAHARRMGEYLKDFTCVERVELLPFHKMGEYKWADLGLPYKLTDVLPPEQEQVDEIKEILNSYGLECK